MGVEVVHVAALLAADVTLPGVGVAVAAFMQEVQGGVGEGNAAERTYERGRQQRGLAVRRRDHAAFRRGRAGRLQRNGHVSRGLFGTRKSQLFIQRSKIAQFSNDPTGPTLV